MELTPQQKQRIAEEVVGFKSWLEGKGKNERQEHLEHGHRIAKLITPEKLSSLTEDGVYELYDSLWASMMWTNKKWYVDNKILNNGLAKVRDSLKNLLYGQGSIEERFDQIYTDAIGLGGAGVSEILHYNFPNQYCLWNDKPKTVLPYLGIDQLPEGFYKYQLKDGHAYQKCIDVINLIRHELENHGIPHPDFIDADLFFWYLFNNIKTQAKSEKSKGKTTSASSNSLAPQLGGFDPNYIPPILSDLEKSAENEQTSTDFERKVGLLFKMLGFQVQQLGSGKGAVPDVIARGYCPDHQYALLIDSKARQNKNYQISTPDQRALTDYARHFFKEYENRGLHAHLLIVSSGFANDQTEKIREIRSNSRIRSVCLITAQDLLFLLESRLKNCKIDVEKLYDLFSTDGIISRERITETLPAE